MFHTIQSAIWAVLIIAICSKINSKKSALLLSTLSGILFTAEILAIYLNGRFIDYQFYTHISLDSLKSFGFQFISQITLFLALWAALSFWIYFFSRKFQSSPLRRNRYFIPIITASFVFLSIPNGVLHEKYQIFQILSAEQKEFESALESLGIPSDEYIAPQKLKATKGKNIIVISLESIEQGFLGKEFPGLTPNLNRLSREWSFYDNFPILPGSTWTAGSLYSYMTGAPAFFANHGNQAFQNTTNVKLTGLGHILEKAGYNSLYIMGKPEFAGTTDILKAYRIPVVSEKNPIGSYPASPAGLHDLDLFAEAKLQISRLRKDSKPFAVFMSTINTHFPNGIYDARMEKIIPKRASNLEFSVAAADYLVDDFIRHLEKEGVLNDSIVYIFPDHALMGSGETVDKLKKDNRQAYLITNAPKKDYSILHHVDLPRVIIEGAGISTNAKFVSDYIKAKDREQFFRSNQSLIASLNEASVAKINFQSGIKITLNDKSITVASSAKQITATLGDPKKDTIDFIFSRDMEPIEWKKVNPQNALSADHFDEAHKRLHLLISVSEDGINSYLGNKKLIGLYKNGKSISYTAEEVSAVISSNRLDGFQIPNKKERKLHIASGIVAVTSSEYRTHKEINSELSYNGSKFRPQRGLNIFHRDPEKGYILENYDTFASREESERFIDKIKNLIQSRSFWVAFSHDAIKTSWPETKQKLKDIGLHQLSRIDHRVAYIAYCDEEGKIYEFSSGDSLTHYIRAFERPPTEEEIQALQDALNAKTAAANLYRTDWKRFIAHAGGSIDGKTYTNSREALETNYENGFRIFELDIIQTSDGHYVAAHDWEHWRKLTGYSGATPPTRESFMGKKIHGRYSPMDLIEINKWFQEHPDAILVTDKVNQPLDFAERFVDRRRLMMELFSWEAVEEALKANIKGVMPTASLLNRIQGNKIEYLKKLGVTHIAASRRMAEQQSSLLEDLAKSGIKIFAFHVNFDRGKDETHVICHEMSYFYGLYADKWDFDAEIECRKP